jgi:hypothetical protein
MVSCPLTINDDNGSGASGRSLHNTVCATRAGRNTTRFNILSQTSFEILDFCPQDLPSIDTKINGVHPQILLAPSNLFPGHIP